MAAPTNVYMVNYFPITNGGFSMWSSYNGPQCQADMATAKALGFNTIRVQIAARTGCFDFSSPTSPELANLTDFYNRSVTVGIKLHLCLFDQFGGYGKITASTTWITAIMGALPSTSNIQAVEMQNEQLFGSTLSTYSQGYDGGWVLATTGLTDGQIYREWTHQMLAWMHTNYSSVPTTVSAATGGRYFNGQGFHIAAAYTAFNGNAWAPDWYEWHPYDAAGFEYSTLCNVGGQVGGNANLFCGETGYNTIAATGQTVAQSYVAQRDYIKALRSAAQVLGMSEPAPWQLFDVLPCTQFTTPAGNYYGLYDSTGTIKPAGQLYVDNPPGTANLPAADLNNLSYGPQLLYGSLLPLRWRPVQGYDGTQTIVGAIDYTTTYLGRPMTALTGSASATTPQWATEVAALWPVVSPGHSFTFKAAMKGSGTTGSPFLSIGWYDGTGTLLSTTSGSALTLTGTTTVYTVSGTAPASTVYARLAVNTPGNAGTIWFGAALWTGASPRIHGHGGHWYRH